MTRLSKAFFIIILSILVTSGCGGNAFDSLSPVREEKAAEESAAETPADSEENQDNENEEVINIPVEETPIAVGDEDSSDTDASNTASEENSFEGYILSDNDTPENNVYLKSTAEPGRVVIDFAGDINFDDRYANMVSLRGRANGIFDSIDSALIERTNAADIFMINNEFPYSNRGTPTPNKKFTFRAKPETVSMLNDLGTDIVSLANNHAYDHGPDALLDTFDTLDNAGIPYVGAGHDINEAQEPVYFIAGGMKIAFVSATQIERSLPPDTKEATETEPGVLRTLDPERFLNVIRTAKENSDFVIAYVHWGSENTNIYEYSQTELARAYTDAGAGLIIGAHPHVLQGIEYMDDTPVLYSLGNYWFNSKTLDNCLVEAIIDDKEIASLQFIPCMQYNCATHALSKDSPDYVRILDEMRQWSTENVIIDGDGFIEKNGH